MIYFDKEKNAYAFEIENYIATIDDSTWDNYAGSDKWDIINGKFVDITNTTEYKRKTRLSEIEEELKQEDEKYEKVLNTPVEYKNGFFYKPKYVQESYILLLASNIFPITIWDSTELNSSVMTKEELQELALFLKNSAEKAFQERKENRKKLIKEREEIE